MENKEWKVLKGWWISSNEFEDVWGSTHTIVPYKRDLDEYKDKFPLACYVQLYGRVVKNLVLRDEEYN